MPINCWHKVIAQYPLLVTIAGCCTALCLLFQLFRAEAANPQPTRIEDTLPGIKQITGWQRQGAPYVYRPDNLYQYIDGAADQFILYGFIKLYGAEYTAATDNRESITIDVYDMGSHLSAFGIFNSKRDPASARLNIGAESFGNDQYVAFYKGRFYVEIQSRISSEKNRSTPMAAADQVAKKISAPDKRPSLLDLFPETDKVSGSENYVAGGILGHGFLPKGVVSEYRSNGEIIRSFIAPFASPAAAVTAFEQYKKFLAGIGKPAEQNNKFGKQSFVAQEPYHKKIVVARQGCFVAGVTDLSNIKQGTGLLEKIVTNLKKARCNQ